MLGDPRAARRRHRPSGGCRSPPARLAARAMSRAPSRAARSATAPGRRRPGRRARRRPPRGRRDPREARAARAAPASATAGGSRATVAARWPRARQIDLDQVRSQHLDGANGQTLGGVFDVRLQRDARQPRDRPDASFEDPDIDRVDAAEPSVSTMSMTASAWRSTAIVPPRHANPSRAAPGRRGARRTRRRAQRQQLPVEPRHRFGRFGRRRPPAAR